MLPLHRGSKSLSGGQANIARNLLTHPVPINLVHEYVNAGDIFFMQQCSDDEVSKASLYRLSSSAVTKQVFG